MGKSEKELTSTQCLAKIETKYVNYYFYKDHLSFKLTLFAGVLESHGAPCEGHQPHRQRVRQAELLRAHAQPQARPAQLPQPPGPGQQGRHAPRLRPRRLGARLGAWVGPRVRAWLCTWICPWAR